MLYLIAGAVAAYAAYQLFFANNRDRRPSTRASSHSRSYESLRRRDERQPRRNIISSQRDRTPAESTEYASLRARAKQEGDLMAQCYQQSKDAYERRVRVRAKALSDEGKRHASKMEKLNRQASATIFRENNQDSDACRVDLHGLYVKEAIAYSVKAVADACRRGDPEIRLIVGQGNHSEAGISKLRPAIQDDMHSRGHRVEVDPRNPGVLLVQLGGR